MQVCRLVADPIIQGAFAWPAKTTMTGWQMPDNRGRYGQVWLPPSGIDTVG